MIQRLIYETFEKVKSQNEDTSTRAITDLCCILEIRTHNFSIGLRHSRYGTYISQEILEIDINEHEEKEIVKFIHDEIINQDRELSGLLFAIGQSSCKVGLKPVINIIRQCLHKFNENEFYQTLISLERILFFDESLSTEEQTKILKETEILIDLSKKLLFLEPISHSDLEATFARLSARLILLLNGVYID